MLVDGQSFFEWLFKQDSEDLWFLSASKALSVWPLKPVLEDEGIAFLSALCFSLAYKSS